MIFSELYSAYYNTVAAIISRIIDGERDERRLKEEVLKLAFAESVLTILPSLKSERWQLVQRDMTTPIKHAPTMPLTEIERRWLASIVKDKRIALFKDTLPDLSDTTPLFTEEDYKIYDSYSDGDDYTDPDYIKRFRLLLSAIKSESPVRIVMTRSDGGRLTARCVPVKLEYSKKDDKFRVVTKGSPFVSSINLARIVSVKLIKSAGYDTKEKPAKAREMVLKITDERNALERVMLHFAHFEKRAERVSDKEYTLLVKYDKSDSAEMVTRVLTFGPYVELSSPVELREMLIKRLKKQISCGLK